MGFEKAAGFYLTSLGSSLILLATFAFAFLTYRRRREKGFLFLLLAVGITLFARVLILLFMGPATFTSMDHTTRNTLSQLVWGLGYVGPLVGLIGWVMLSQKTNYPPPPGPPNTSV